jgi:hypothetical protein
LRVLAVGAAAAAATYGIGALFEERHGLTRRIASST